MTQKTQTTPEKPMTAQQYNMKNSVLGQYGFIPDPVLPPLHVYESGLPNVLAALIAEKEKIDAAISALEGVKTWIK